MDKETEPEAEIIEEGILEFTTREEYINCACNCLNAAGEINAMTGEETEKINGIKRKCISIIDMCVTEMYDELFEEGE